MCQCFMTVRAFSCHGSFTAKSNQWYHLILMAALRHITNVDTNCLHNYHMQNMELSIRLSIIIIFNVWSPCSGDCINRMLDHDGNVL